MSEVKEVEIHELVQDDRNLNLGTPEGEKLIRESIGEDGLGRSVFIDKHNKIIAGNKTTKGAIANGVKKVRIIETDGTELIAVKRIDLDLDTDPQARRMAFRDNSTAHANLNFDIEEAEAQSEEFGFSIEGIKGDEAIVEMVNRSDENDEWVGMPEFEAKEPTFKIVIHFEHESDREGFADKHQLEFNSKQKSSWSTTYPFKVNEGSSGMRYE